MKPNLKDIYQHTIILAEDIACAIEKHSTERMRLDDAYDNLGGATERQSESLIFVEEALENLEEALASLTLDAKFMRENWDEARMTPPCDAECMRANDCGGASECPQCGKSFCPEYRGVWLNDRCFCSPQCAQDYEDNL